MGVEAFRHNQSLLSQNIYLALSNFICQLCNVGVEIMVECQSCHDLLLLISAKIGDAAAPSLRCIIIGIFWIICHMFCEWKSYEMSDLFR